MRQYVKNSWDGATDEAKRAYGRGAKSFDELYDRAPKTISNERYVMADKVHYSQLESLFSRMD